MEDRQAQMLEKVRALLAKASSTEFPEEAETFRAKADELMTKYAIELWQIEQAQAGVNAQRVLKPEMKMMDISWWINTDREVGSALWQVYSSLARHCRVRTVGAHTEYVRTPDGLRYEIPVLGLPTDLGYFDMIFTHLFVQMMDKMDPQVKEGDTLIDALVRMKEAGLKWEEIHRRLRKAGLVPDEPWSKQVASKMNFAGKYTRYCEEHNRPRTYVTPSVYRRSFLRGFQRALQERLRNQVEEQGRNTGSTAIALRGIDELIRDLLYELFPDLRPHPDDCDCDDCHECDDPKCERAWCKAQRSARNRRLPRLKEEKLSLSAMQAGTQAGREVEIINDSAQVGGRKKELT